MALNWWQRVGAWDFKLSRATEGSAREATVGEPESYMRPCRKGQCTQCTASRLLQLSSPRRSTGSAEEDLIAACPRRRPPLLWNLLFQALCKSLRSAFQMFPAATVGLLPVPATATSDYSIAHFLGVWCFQAKDICTRNQKSAIHSKTEFRRLHRWKAMY